MGDFLLDYYLWLKVLHILSFISWMAALLYAPRLFVYHVDAPKGSQQSETFKIMERRLLRIIGNSAMIATWFFGGLMLWANPSLFSYGWLHAKLTAVVLLTGVHHYLIYAYKKFEKDENVKSSKFYRVLNEIPTILMIIIVIMVIIQPF